MPTDPNSPSPPPVLSDDEGPALPPPPRTFTLNGPYALEALCRRERTMLPRFPRLRYPGEVDRVSGAGPMER